MHTLGTDADNVVRTGAAAVAGASSGSGSAPGPRVAAIVVTWNRRGDVDRCLRAIAAQAFPAARLDVVVVDNASTDGTADHVFEAWRPSRVVHNGAEAAERPQFEIGRAAVARNAGGWRSLTLVRNATNLGGCGGFNTGFLIVERTIASHRDLSALPEAPGAARAEPLGYVWLVDDDAVPAPDCLERLVATAESDPAIGIVGSRMVDPNDTAITLESTVFFNPSTGLFGPPEPEHPRHAEHEAWLARVGSPKGRHDAPDARSAMTGARDVDCVAACSLLARWSEARRLGYWDARFFITGDDADWCLRFGRAGLRVVCDLDAVVHHLPWIAKRTTLQDHYRRRNLFWLWERALGRDDLRRLASARVALILRQARQAIARGRALDAEIMRRSAHDAAANRGGRLKLSARPGVAPVQIEDALRAIGADRRGATLAAVCPSQRTLRQALRLRRTAARVLSSSPPKWVLFIAADAIGDRLLARMEGLPDVRVVRYARRRRSMLRRQFGFLLSPPRAWVVFDGRTDVPLLHCSRVLHVDTRARRARAERHIPGSRPLFVVRWLWTWLRCRFYLWRLEPREFRGRFGDAAG
ncbi:MAG: glycosyltransferase family 2 protein [Phycisphaerales bacterium]|nr:glycosyltransferase family 2 protein [Phycisphaerales bacterium]